MSEIHTERLTLRPFVAGDLPAFMVYRSDPEVARYQSWGVPFTRVDAERFLASQRGIQVGTRGKWSQLAAIRHHDRTLIGDCAVLVSAEQPATAEVGVTFAREHQGYGFAREALAALITSLFRDHDLHRVYAQIDARNQAAQRLFASLGFRCEARLIDADWFKGAWSSLMIYAVLRREWNPGPRGQERR